ncbi:hypothetical protein [Streptomyces sp. CBMA156]|nr:hypothetical protein [Streptomyces sp. CBMA156]
MREQAGEVSYRMPDGTPIGLALTRGEAARNTAIGAIHQGEPS